MKKSPLPHPFIPCSGVIDLKLTRYDIYRQYVSIESCDESWENRKEGRKKGWVGGSLNITSFKAFLVQ